MPRVFHSSKLEYTLNYVSTRKTVTVYSDFEKQKTVCNEFVMIFILKIITYIRKFVDFKLSNDIRDKNRYHGITYLIDFKLMSIILLYIYVYTPNMTYVLEDNF